MTAMPSLTLLALPDHWPPTLFVVVDTEEEFDWSAPFDPAATSTANIQFQPLARAVFEAHGVVPLHAVDYPVATNPAAVEVLRRMAEDGACEIGAHLHPWVNPPHEGPVDARHSYPGNLPRRLERAKLGALTEAIAASFGHRPLVYKAGRYGLGPNTAGILAELGYRIDASVVPWADFRRQHGPDFRHLPNAPMRLGEGVVELPLTVGFVGMLGPLGRSVYPMLASGVGQRLRLPALAARLGLVERLRLTPEGHSLDDLIRVTRAALARGTRLFALTYHSSALLPGATSYVRDEAERREFLSRIDRYLAFFLGRCGGRSLPVTRVGQSLAGSAAWP